MAAGMLMALVLVGAACGSSTKTAAVAATTTTTAATRAAQTQAFIQCMQRHGVPITSTRGLGGRGPATGSGDTGTTRSAPAPTLPPGVSQQQYTAALQACRDLLPARGANPQNSAAAQAYRNCLNLQLQQAGSTTLPPIGQGGGGGGGGGGFGQGASTTAPSPAVQAARAHCANLLPAGGSGRGGATTTTPTT